MNEPTIRRGPGRPPKGEALADLARAMRPFDEQVMAEQRSLLTKLLSKLLDLELPGDPVSVAAVREVGAVIGREYYRIADVLAERVLKGSGADDVEVKE